MFLYGVSYVIFDVETGKLREDITLDSHSGVVRIAEWKINE